jgi:hypothetical protein
VHNFIKNFRRETGGVWECESSATIDLPQGRVQVVPGERFTAGIKFMNVDVARLLDAEYSKHNTK